MFGRSWYNLKVTNVKVRVVQVILLRVDIFVELICYQWVAPVPVSFFKDVFFCLVGSVNEELNCDETECAPTRNVPVFFFLPKSFLVR